MRKKKARQLLRRESANVLLADSTYQVLVNQGDQVLARVVEVIQRNAAWSAKVLRKTLRG